MCKEDNDKDNNDVNNAVGLKILVGVSILVLIVFIPYANKFIQQSTSNNPANWGVFGDYVGGLLNPFFALIAIYLIFLTYKEQRKEIKKMSRALESQEVINRKQQFESTFFSMLDFFQGLSNSLEIKVTKKTGPQRPGQQVIFRQLNYTGKSAFSNQYFRFKEIYSNVVSGDNIQEKALENRSEIMQEIDYSWKQAEQDRWGIFSHYYKFLVKLFEFIERSTPEILEKNFYIDVLVSQFSDYELRILFYYCLAEDDHNLKTFAIKYKMFSPLIGKLEIQEHEQFLEYFNTNQAR